MVHTQVNVRGNWCNLEVTEDKSWILNRKKCNMKKCLHSALSFNGLLILLLCMHCCCCALILWCCIYKDSFSSLFLCLRIWRRCCLSPLTPGSSCTLSCMPARRSCCSASSPPSLPTLCTTGKRRLHTQLQLSNYGSQRFRPRLKLHLFAFVSLELPVTHSDPRCCCSVSRTWKKRPSGRLTRQLDLPTKNNKRKIKMCPNRA